MTAAKPHRKDSRPAYTPPQPAHRRANIIAFDFVRKRRLTTGIDSGWRVTQFVYDTRVSLLSKLLKKVVLVSSIGRVILPVSRSPRGR